MVAHQQQLPAGNHFIYKAFKTKTKYPCPDLKETGDVVTNNEKNSESVLKKRSTIKGDHSRKPDNTQGEKPIPLVSENPPGDYPKIIRRLKYEYSNLYTNRSLLHKKMRSIDEKNSPVNMKNRAMLLQQIKELSGQMDHL